MSAFNAICDIDTRRGGRDFSALALKFVTARIQAFDLDQIQGRHA
jgi:hypothetical protein